ncbi:MAG: class I SAM-dependent methyltransferase [Desulfotignum sp.]|nr:class I SAM-dependent methyltransferase [Desulfotignum sp.]MCF8125432.1 class I SAM-dependent methyltransferase [Desulfotignum sp.]
MGKIDFNLLHATKGFMADEEASRLHSLALTAASMGPVLEIGSYCGRSAAVMGWACKRQDSVVFSIDHHTGSEEQQPGEAYFDPDLYDKHTGRINTLPFFLQTIEKAGLTDHVVPMVCGSVTAGKMWRTPLSMVFIDGGHSFEAAYQDFLTWSPHIMADGFLVIHDIFLDPAQGGQAPRQVYEIALQTGDYAELSMTLTLGVLQQKPVV